MAIKKTQIYNKLWEMCDKLRGGIDPAQYKNYILTLLFVKYISDRYASEEFPSIGIPDEGRFSTIVAAKNKANIGEVINIALRAIENDPLNCQKLGGLLSVVDFNDDKAFGSGREKIEKLSKLIAIFEEPELDFSRNRASGDDIIGDAYEYLMRKFAVESGKSKGQFYTPGEVSRVMAHLIGIDRAAAHQSVYDPACGSGSLLLRAAALVPASSAGTFSIYGQEVDNTTAGLAMMNLVLHERPTAMIQNANTLASPKFLDPRDATRMKQFDYVVSNPPFSKKNWMDGVDKVAYHRFDGYVLPPEKNGDYAWMLHILASLKSTGSAAVILPHGVLFRGNAEEAIRKEIIARKYIEAIIGLPANIFFGTGIPASIIVLNKSRAAGRTGIFFIDASGGFVKDGNKNRLREQDIRKIVDVFAARLAVPFFSRHVLFDEIERNGFNLNIPRYIETRDTEETQNLDGHLNGGISLAELDALGDYWSAFPGLRPVLFKRLRAGFDTLRIAAEDVCPAILAHPSVAAFRDAALSAFKEWSEKSRREILSADAPANELVESLAASMRDAYTGNPLIDKYDAYGVFMDYALATMQDDLYAIRASDWVDAGREIEILKKSRKSTEWEGAVIPKILVQRRHLPGLRKKADACSAETEAAESGLERFLDAERDRGEESPLFDGDEILPDAKLRNVRPEEDKAVVAEYFALKKAVKEARAARKDADKALDEKTLARFQSLTEAEIKTLLLDDKWFAALSAGIASRFENVVQSFASAVVSLHDRYKDTLPKLEAEAAKSRDEVHSVLRAMGFSWGETP